VLSSSYRALILDPHVSPSAPPSSRPLVRGSPSRLCMMMMTMMMKMMMMKLFVIDDNNDDD